MGAAWCVTLFYGRVGYQPKDSFPSRGSAGKQTRGRYFLHPGIFSRVVCHIAQIRIHSIVESGKELPVLLPTGRNACS